MKKLFTFLAIMSVALFSATAQVSEDFESQTEDEDIAITGWINYTEAGSYSWYADYYNGLFAKFSAYKSGDDSNIAWLITPGVNLDEYENDSIKFDIAYGYYTHDALAVKYSLNFDGTKDGISTATWIDITDQFSYPEKLTSGYTDFISTSTNIDNLSGTIYVAFVYTGSATNSQTTTIEIDNVVVGNPKPQSKITAFSVNNQLLDADIDKDNATVSLTVYPGTDVTNLVPEIEISEGASISPAAGNAQDFTNPVTYTVTSSDGESVTTWTVTVNILSDTPTSIHDLQYVSDPATDDASPYVGEPIFTTGIVTYGTGSGNIAYIQSTAGEWNGIYVYISSSKTNISLSKGDSVLVYGTVSEYYNLTEFIPDSVYTVADRKSVSATSVSDSLTESLEGVLVSISGATLATDADSTSDSKAYLLATANGIEYKIYDEICDDIEFESGKTYDITGVVTYSYSNYRICPRSISDVTETTGVNELSQNTFAVYPNPTTSVLTVKGIDATNVTVKNIMGQTVAVKALSNNQINVSDLTNGVYFIQANNKIVRFVKQ